MHVLSFSLFPLVCFSAIVTIVQKARTLAKIYSLSPAVFSFSFPHCFCRFEYLVIRDFRYAISRGDLRNARREYFGGYAAVVVFVLRIVRRL